MNVESLTAKLQPVVYQVVQSKKDEIVAETPVVLRWALKACWGFLTGRLLPLIVRLSVHAAVAYVLPWIVSLLQVLIAGTVAVNAKNANKLMLDLVDASRNAPSELDKDVVAVLRSMGVMIQDKAEPSIDGLAYWKD